MKFYPIVSYNIFILVFRLRLSLENRRVNFRFVSTEKYLEWLRDSQPSIHNVSCCKLMACEGRGTCHRTNATTGANLDFIKSTARTFTVSLQADREECRQMIIDFALKEVYAISLI